MNVYHRNYRDIIAGGLVLLCNFNFKSEITIEEQMNNREYTYTTTLKLTRDEAEELDVFSHSFGFPKSHILRTGMTLFMNEVKNNNLTRLVQGE